MSQMVQMSFCEYDEVTSKCESLEKNLRSVHAKLYEQEKEIKTLHGVVEDLIEVVEKYCK